MKPIDINLKKDIMLIDILDEFAEDIDQVPTEEAKQFFRDWNNRVPAKLIRTCIFAGMHYSLKHKNDIEVKWAEETSYKCPHCKGDIYKVILSERGNGGKGSWRWTCSKCQRDYGYDEERPLIEEG